MNITSVGGRHAALDRMSQSLYDRMASRGGRVDIALQDWHAIDKNSAKILASFDPSFGAPSSQTVASWVVAAHDGRLVPHIDSLRFHPKLGAFSLVVSGMQLVRPGKDKENMIPVVAGLKFLDSQTGTNWQVSHTPNGQEILRQDVALDVNSILANSRSRTTSSMRMNMAEHGIVMEANMGDRVSFFHDGQTKTGLVTSIHQTGYRIATEKGACVAALDSIIEVLAAGEGSTDLTQKELVDFYTKVYGDKEFAKALVTASMAVANDGETPVSPVAPIKPEEVLDPVQPVTQVAPETDKATGSATSVGLKRPQVTLAKEDKNAGAGNSPVTLMTDGVDVPHQVIKPSDDKHFTMRKQPLRFGKEKEDTSSPVTTSASMGNPLGHVVVGNRRIPVVASADCPIDQQQNVKEMLSEMGDVPNEGILKSSNSPGEAARKLGEASMKTTAATDWTQMRAAIQRDRTKYNDLTFNVPQEEDFRKAQQYTNGAKAMADRMDAAFRQKMLAKVMGMQPAVAEAISYALWYLTDHPNVRELSKEIYAELVKKFRKAKK